MEAARRGHLGGVLKTGVQGVSAFYGPKDMACGGLGRLTKQEKPAWKDRWASEIHGLSLGLGSRELGKNRRNLVWELEECSGRSGKLPCV